MSEKMVITIYFVDGETRSFEFTPQAGADWSSKGKLEKLFNSAILPMEVDGKLYLYPVCNIRSIEVSPSPGNLSGIAIINLKEII